MSAEQQTNKEYDFKSIEQKWQQQWAQSGAYKVPNPPDATKPKYYVLDMFPYPSGAGLHVGHPLGYIASDIYARYKRLKGYNVLHPMGYDAFGLPAEQYAIEHGVHPAVSTAKNIATFRSQLDKIGFCFDWDREVNTSEPKYYKWTQWIFLQLFNSWYNRQTNKTEKIETLLAILETEGNINHPVPNSNFQIPSFNQQQSTNNFSADEWKGFDEKTKQTILMEYRIAYCGYGEVNWCEALGTVLANDEVINGVSERGGHPVVKKKLRQWYLRITEYADRLLQGLQTVDFSDAMKEMQGNWIGKSSGAEISFRLTPNSSPSGEGKSGLPNTKYQTADLTSWQTLKEYGRENRKNATEAENLLWQYLRNNQIGVKVRRQHAIENYIADFVIAETNLVIEIDGGYHDELEQKALDQHRDEILATAGFETLRFTNDEVIKNTKSVVQQIKDYVAASKTTQHAKKNPSPLSARRGAGGEASICVYTTRPDTIFGVDFMVVAPEHDLVKSITTPDQKVAVDEYLAYVKSRSERERMAEKKISGVFTGAYVEHPFTGLPIPVWTSEYVLAGYGTGAIMAVPSGDERDLRFAQHFGIPVTNIWGDAFNGEEAVTDKNLPLHNSDFVTGMQYKEASEAVINKLVEEGTGVRKTNYKMRDAAFSRQRYWGEPFPIKWVDGVAYALDESELPLELPHVDKYGPGPEGEGPLANIPDWYLTPSPSPQVERGEVARRETNTMPGYAGSSWYFLRYMDPHNDQTFADKAITSYWNQVDLYVGGTEHAVGHLLYSRMWTKALYDLGYITFDEPFKKLLNQGMIGGKSFYLWFIYVVNPSSKNRQIKFVHSSNKEKTNGKYLELEFVEDRINKLRDGYPIPYKFLDENYRLTYEGFVRMIDPNLSDFHVQNIKKRFFEKEIQIDLENDVEWKLDKDGTRYIELEEVNDKMSKSKGNTVNPDDVVDKYGADTFRMYEMFLGPVEVSKPWDTKGIEGVHRFLKKLWRLFYTDAGFAVVDEPPTDAEYKVLHKTIKKIEEDTERFSFNTCVSAFMVCVNELTDLKCRKTDILEPLLILLTPYAPHIAEELYQQLRRSPSLGEGAGRWAASVLDASFPKWNEKYLVESNKEYPVSVNGKLRTTLNFSVTATKEEVEPVVLQNEIVQKWLEGKEPKKIIFVPNKMINVVV